MGLYKNLLSQEVYNFMFEMKQIPMTMIVLLLFFSLRIGQCSPFQYMIGEEYEGEYTSQSKDQNFGYLDGHSGRILAVFYGTPNRDSINSLEIALLDPKYEDEKVVIVEVKGCVTINETSKTWENASHAISSIKIYKEREGDTVSLDKISTKVTLHGTENDDYEEVTMEIEMKGANFEFKASLTYYNQILSTLGYSLYVTFAILIQIYCSFRILKIMDAPNFVFTAKFSLLTLSLCNIQDFSQTMTHIQYIMGSSSGYLYFVLPSLAYILLFIIFDMKMLFLVWKSHNLVHMDNPQQLRKKLTAFYIQFYIGLFIYLTLNYFFTFDGWFIVARNLVLLPQIIHNVKLGQKPVFNAFYIFGYIGTRLLVPFYQRTCTENRFKLSPNISVVVVLFAIFALQVILLAIQTKYGPRFFVPKRFLPNYYEYKHKIVQTEDNKHEDCAICLQNLFDRKTVQSFSSSNQINESIQQSIQEELIQQATIMKTPCNHSFHIQCLTQWLDVKLECPSCRATLPPI